MKHPDCKHYTKGGWCAYRKGKNVTITKTTMKLEYVKMRCSEICRHDGDECRFYESTVKDDTVKQCAKDCVHYFAPTDMCNANLGSVTPAQPYICNVSFGCSCSHFKTSKQ
ncbi:MAG: hypothetical protein HDR88_10135 [Bacteroides sp.]|nr:hypothetical protein [Bacteroides sp.]